MLRDKLDKLLEAVNALDLPEEPTAWDAAAFERLNNRLLAILNGAADQVGSFRERVVVRRGLQALYSHAGEIDSAVAQEIWREQCAFYPQLIEEIRQCIGEGQPSLVTFSLTVAELLYLLRGFLENGLIQTDTLQPILGFFSEHAQTRQGRKLSFASLQKKYSRVEPETQKRVKRLLLDLAMHIDST